LKTYLVTYEINDPTRKEKVIKRLQGYELYCPIHENAVAIITLKQHLEILQDIQNIISKKDRLLVMETKKNATWINSQSEKHSDWLLNYL
jgi:hypothetical protein